MDNTKADNSLPPTGTMHNVPQATSCPDHCQLKKRNDELQKELIELREFLQRCVEEAKELREELKEPLEDVSRVKVQAAKLQHEVKVLQKPRRTTQRKRDLDQAVARVTEVEKLLETANTENNQLKDTSQRSQQEAAHWSAMYQGSIARSIELEQRIHQLEETNAALAAIAGNQQPLDAPALANAQGMNDLGFEFDMGANTQMSSQPQGEQPNDPMEQFQGFDQVGGYSYPQDPLSEPNAWQNDMNFNMGS
ncbi:hypothetical protein ABKA04_001227 [Annulohypoxylon sp. FPYF3050]